MELTPLQLINPEIEIIDLKSPNYKRKLAYLFLDLPYHSRMSIASELNLIEDSDKDLSAIQISQIYFKKAVEQKILDQLWDKIAMINPDIQKLINPFKN